VPHPNGLGNGRAFGGQGLGVRSASAYAARLGRVDQGLRFAEHPAIYFVFFPSQLPRQKPFLFPSLNFLSIFGEMLY